MLEFHRKEPKFLISPKNNNYMRYIALFSLKNDLEVQIDVPISYKPEIVWDTKKLVIEVVEDSKRSIKSL